MTSLTMVCIVGYRIHRNNSLLQNIVLLLLINASMVLAVQASQSARTGSFSSEAPKCFPQVRGTVLHVVVNFATQLRNAHARPCIHSVYISRKLRGDRNCIACGMVVNFVTQLSTCTVMHAFSLWFTYPGSLHHISH